MDKKSREFADELVIKEEQLKLSLEAANAGMWVRDAVGEWKATPELNTLFGRSIDDPPLLEEEFVDYIHPEDLPRIKKAYIHARDGKSYYSQEYRVIWPDGSIHWLASKGKFVLENDKPRFIGITYEITESKNAEKAHHESKQLYKQFFDNPLNGFALCEIITDDTGKSADFVYLKVNKAFENFTGLKRENVINKRVTEILPFEDVAELIQIYGKVALTGESTYFQYPIPSLGKYYEVSAFSPKNKQFIAFFTDITEHKKAEEELKESEERYRRIVETANEGIWEMDNQYITMNVNPAMAAMLGYTIEEMIGRYIPDFLFEEDIKEHAERMNNREKGAFGKYETRLKHKDGSERWALVSATPKKDSNGNFSGSFAMFVDITDRKKAEGELMEALDNSQRLNEELEVSNEKLKQQGDELLQVNKSLWQSREDMSRAQEVGKIGSWRLDTRRNVLTWSDENHRIFGVPKGTPLTYETFLEIVHPDDRQYVDTQWNAGLAGEPYDIEHRIVVGTKVKWVREKAYLEFNDEGIVLGGFGITQDITDRKKLEEELRQARDHLEEQVEKRTVELEETIKELERSNQELQSFAYITSHDLQEPLRTIGNYAGLLKRRYEGQFDEDADDFLNFMAAGAARMKEMVQGLLDYSRVGTRGGEFKEFNAEEALNSTLINLQSLIEECHAEITHDSLPTIVADESQITRVFQNLISNALKFRKKRVQPKIHVTAKKEDNEYVFSVSDNGIGIEEQYTGRIFEVFKRLHPIGEYEGAGIGLAIVKRIIDLHGGRVWVESQLGNGSTFYFTIPLKQDETGEGYP